MRSSNFRHLLWICVVSLLLYGCTASGKKEQSKTNKEEASTQLPKLTSMLDKLAKKNIIHKKKASNLKSSLVKHVNSL